MAIIEKGQGVNVGETEIPDNDSSALKISSSDAKDYVILDTTNSDERIKFVQEVTVPDGSINNPSIRFTGHNTGFHNDGGHIAVVLDGARTYKLGTGHLQRYDVSRGFEIDTAAGTATNPVYAFNGDTDTGVGTGAADELSLIAGGVEGIRLTEDTTILAEIKGKTIITDPSGPSGNIAEASTAADTLIIDTATDGGVTVVGEVNDPMRLHFVADDYDYRSGILAKAKGASGSASTRYLNFYTGGQGRMFLNQIGLGIGTEAPAKALHVVNSALVKGRASFVLTGSINVTGTNTDVPGTETKYLTELSVGDAIVVSGETRTIATITDDTTATVTAAWGSDLANDTSPECNPAAFTVIRDTGDLGMVLDDNGLVGLGEVVPSAYWANTNDLVIGSGSSSGITIDASSTGTLCFAYGTSGAAAYQNVIQGTGSGSGDGIRFITAGTTKECIRITTAGDILCPQLDADSDVLTDANKNLTTSSDMRLKNPIAELEAGLDKINQLVPRFFSWKNDEENKSQLGFFSQEVHSICPEAAPKSPKMVSTETEVGEDGANACDGEKVQALDADGNPDFNWSLNSRAIVALLVKSVQELSAKVAELEAGD